MSLSEPVDLKSARWQHTLDHHILEDPAPSARMVALRYVQTPWCQCALLLVLTIVTLCTMAPPMVQTRDPNRPIEKGRLSGWRLTGFSLLVCVLFIAIVITTC